MSKHSLLIVDQDAYYAGIYAKRFETAGWKVWVEESFPAACKRVERSVPDVVMVDFDPLDSASTFLRDLRSQSKTSKVIQIALVTKGGRLMMEEALSVGVDRYVLKSHLAPMEVVKSIKYLLEEKNV